MFHQYILIYTSYKGYNKHRRLKILRWGLECTKSRIVIKGKEVVLVSSLFKLFTMLLKEESFGKVMNLGIWGEQVL